MKNFNTYRHGDDENPRSSGFNACLERVKKALQQAGIEVKHG